MPEVTINAADLEALLFTAGAANASPDAKKILKRDPQFEQVEGRLTDAINSASGKWRTATREGAFPERFADPTAEEMRWIVILAKRDADPLCLLGVEEDMNLLPRSLVTNGFIELGVYSETTIWAGQSRPSVYQHPGRRVRLTARGLDFYLQSVDHLEIETLKQQVADLEEKVQRRQYKHPKSLDEISSPGGKGQR